MAARGGCIDAVLASVHIMRVTVSNYATDEAAKRELFRLEQAYPNADIVYVTGETTDAVRLAYKNYFDDAVEFLEKVKSATRELGIIPPVLG